MPDNKDAVEGIEVHYDTYDGLRSFIDGFRKNGELKEIQGADWNLEITTLSEAVCENIAEPPAILFDNIKDYPEGFRVLSLPFASRKRVAIIWDAPLDTPKLELGRFLAARVNQAKSLPPREVPDGPVMENVMTGNEIDLYKFPVMMGHDKDGGRYIGTGDTLINKDPDSDFTNMGTYRMQLHGANKIGLFSSPGQHGQVICTKWWDKGLACPVVATYGGDPLIFMASSTRWAWGMNELDYVGGIRGEPVEVIKGPITGLPIPAHAEIAIEGEIPPPSEEKLPEGPFGEWTGYYAGGLLGIGRDQPVINVKAVYHRNNPILVNMAPQWPGAPYHSVRLSSGMMWEQMEKAGVPGIKGVYIYHQFLVAVSIEQRYAGHAKQAGMAALSAAANASLAKYYVVVDEDIDPSNIQEVVWAMETRVDPATDIQIIDDCWAGPLEPSLTPEKRMRGERTIARAIFYAERPYHWKDKFPMVNRASRASMKDVMDKYRSDRLPFPEV